MFTKDAYFAKIHTCILFIMGCLNENGLYDQQNSLNFYLSYHW